MQNKRTIIDRFIYPKDKENSLTYLKGRFFVGSTFVFFLLCFSAIPYYAIVNPDEIKKQFGLFVFNILMLGIILGIIFIYKKLGRRVLLVNIMTLFGYFSSFGVLEGAGIYTPDNMWGFLIASWVFLVGDKRSGIVWFMLSVVQLTILYYADLNNWRDFHGFIAQLTSGYYYFNYVLAALFLLIIIYLHEKSKDQFLGIIVKSKEELEAKSKELEIKSKDITDSINYAKRIQYAVLPLRESIYRSIPLSFIYYQPKDIVSGDFFWFHEIDKDNYILVCADCTGHGVPGAFMTVIGSSLLNQIIIEDKIHQPSSILLELDRRIVMTLKQEKEKTLTVQDGMDLSLIKVNKSNKEVIITGAKRPVIFIRDKQMTEYKGSKFSLGGMRTDQKVFNEIRINYVEDDVLYFYTDGYTDQFGGDKGKKFSSKRLKEQFLTMHNLPVQDQNKKLENIMEGWKGELEQVDDMLVMGIKF